MQIKRKALYNLLRMNWLQDSTVEVEPWQVEDYRSLSEEELFDRLESLDLKLDRQTFVAYAADYDTPEELADDLVSEEEDPRHQDRVFLCIFELWRRFVYDKPCFSIFCDELDRQINLYDRDELKNRESIHDVLARLEAVLDENVDEGGDPQEVFDLISAGCANDVEGFLYDFIAEQIDHENFGFAAELIDGFYEYVQDSLRFDFLRTRLVAEIDPTEANLLLRSLVTAVEQDKDLDLKMEMLSFLAGGGQCELFVVLGQQVIPLLKKEEDFQDLLAICIHFYRCLDHDQEEQRIQKIIDKRADYNPSDSINAQDSDIISLSKLMECSGRPSSNV